MMKMKHSKHSILPLLVLGVVCSCQKAEPAGLEEPSAGKEEVIPVHIEGVGEGQTRVDVDGTTGICTWSFNDQVGLYTMTTGSETGSYRAAFVTDGAVRLSLAENQYRTRFAVYPFSCRDDSYYTETDFRVNYPAAYHMANRSAEEMNTFSPIPMVAKNDDSELNFYHVGGLLRLTATSIPTGTTKMEIGFVGEDGVFPNVTGNFSVSDPGTILAKTTHMGSGGKVVTFDNLPAAVDGAMTFNIPLPTNDFSGMTAITLKAYYGNTSKTVRKDFTLSERWGVIQHGEGKALTMDFYPYSFVFADGSAADGRLNSYYVSPGLMKWIPKEGGGENEGYYTITAGEDPFEILNYAGSNEYENIIYHRSFAVFTNTLNYRLEGGPTSGNLVNRFINKDGQTWFIPTPDEIGALWHRGDNSPKINGSARQSVDIVVDLTGTKWEGKGFSTSTGGVETSGESNYHGGTLFFPNDAIVLCPEIKSSGYSELKYETLTWLLDRGCVFFPFTGYINSSSVWAADSCFYLLSTVYYGYSQYYTGSNSIYYSNGSHLNGAFPVRLLRF